MMKLSRLTSPARLGPLPNVLGGTPGHPTECSPELWAARQHPAYVPGRPIGEQPTSVWQAWWAVARPGAPCPCQ